MKQSEKVELIKSSVTLRDVLNAYGYDGDNRRGRIACPLHAGNNKDAFSFNDDVFQCWNCGASGDLISFVMQHDDLDFKSALVKINEIFNIYHDNSRFTQIKKNKIKKAHQERYAKSHFAIRKQYANLKDALCMLDANLIRHAPKSLDGELDERFVEACHNIKFFEYLEESEEWRVL